MSHVKRNLIANYLGQGWRTIMLLAFVPLYIKYLGIEAYGLVGIFVILQGWLSLLDMGMKPALAREMARFTGGGHDTQSIWDLLRSIEIISIIIAGLVTISIWGASGWLATNWVQAEELPVEVLAQAFACMGAVIALQFIESIYTSSIAGLQRQVLLNVVITLMATVRGLGAVGVLIWVSSTITAFFIWQGLVSLVTVALLAGVVYRELPSPSHPARFSMVALIGIWRYAIGMVGITLLALLLTQADKILLSRLLTLEAFGYYALAGVVSSALYAFSGPITAAFYPRFTELLTREDDVALRKTYHQGAQLVTVLMGSAAVVLIVFADQILQLWTGDEYLTQQVSPPMILLALGTMLNALTWIPYHMQLAHGWTSFTVKINGVAVAILVPALLWIVPIYGAIGAAWVWVALNVGYVPFTIHFMHRRLLCSEKWRWYLQDTVIPLSGATVAAVLCHWVSPEDLGRLGELGALLITSVSVLLSAAMAAPMVSHQIAQLMIDRMKLVCVREQPTK